MRPSAARISNPPPDNVCTVTYREVKGEKVITANRDETPLRAARELSPYLTSSGGVWHIAREPLKGGTNIAVGENGAVCVLLNGAFQAHAPGGHYGKSRGLVVLESLEYPTLKAFAEAADLSHTEPFTLLRFGDVTEEMRRDSERTHYTSYSDGSERIWASAQLYSEKVRQDRRRWFRHLLASDPDADALLDFHLRGGEGDPENDMVMNRGGLVKTVSVTSVRIGPGEIAVIHRDLIRDSLQKLDIRRTAPC